MSLVAALFALVFIALIGSAMVQISMGSHVSATDETLSTRAFYAAESGAQYGLNRLFPLDGSAGSCSGSVNLSFTTDGLLGCNATVECADAGDYEGYRHYNLTSTGRCGTGPEAAVRKVEVGARQL